MIDEHHHYHRVQIATGNGRGACGCVQVRSVAVEGGGRVRRMDCAARALAQLLQGYSNVDAGGKDRRQITLVLFLILNDILDTPLPSARV